MLVLFFIPLGGYRCSPYSLSMLGYMDVQGIPAQNGTIPPIQSVCKVSVIMIVVLTEMKRTTFDLLNTTLAVYIYYSEQSYSE